MQKLQFEKETLRTLAGSELYQQTHQFEPIDAAALEQVNGGSLASAVAGAVVGGLIGGPGGAVVGGVVSGLFGA
jgi:hypothetical protein